jgi:hypothetical protein
MYLKWRDNSRPPRPKLALTQPVRIKGFIANKSEAAGEAIGMLLEWWRGCTAMGGVLRNRAIFVAFQGAPALATKLKDPT